MMLWESLLEHNLCSFSWFPPPPPSPRGAPVNACECLWEAAEGNTWASMPRACTAWLLRWAATCSALKRCSHTACDKNERLHKPCVGASMPLHPDCLLPSRHRIQNIHAIGKFVIVRHCKDALESRTQEEIFKITLSNVNVPCVPLERIEEMPEHLDRIRLKKLKGEDLHVRRTLVDSSRAWATLVALTAADSCVRSSSRSWAPCTQ